jgi:hypothetical protein
MTQTLTKIAVARHQLGTAMALFIKDRDPVSVQCLACGGGELIDKIADSQNISTLSTHMLENVPSLNVAKLRKLQRQYWNAFKHMNSRDGQEREDADLLASFDDTKNDVALFVGWWDFYNVTGRLPLPVQVFQVWWYSLNEDKLSPDTDLSTIRAVFPNITSRPRLEQKRRLRRAVEKYRNNQKTLNDPRTESNPLCFPASVFLTGS